MATSASTVDLPEEKAYIAHHFNCPTCCAAGLSGGKQARCADGQQLCRPDERPMLQFWFETGLRPGELQALQWSHIDWERSVARIELNQVPARNNR